MNADPCHCRFINLCVCLGFFTSIRDIFFVQYIKSVGPGSLLLPFDQSTHYMEPESLGPTNHLHRRLLVERGRRHQGVSPFKKTLRYFPLPDTLGYVTLHYITLLYFSITWLCITCTCTLTLTFTFTFTSHRITSHYITLTTLHCTKLHYIGLQYITWDYITYMHTYHTTHASALAYLSTYLPNYLPVTYLP